MKSFQKHIYFIYIFITITTFYEQQLLIITNKNDMNFIFLGKRKFFADFFEFFLQRKKKMKKNLGDFLKFFLHRTKNFKHRVSVRFRIITMDDESKIRTEDRKGKLRRDDESVEKKINKRSGAKKLKKRKKTVKHEKKRIKTAGDQGNSV